MLIVNPPMVSVDVPGIHLFVHDETHASHPLYSNAVPTLWNRNKSYKSKEIKKEALKYRSPTH